MSVRPADGKAPSDARRILIVDDEETIRDSLVDILGQIGYDAVGATDGADALRILRASSQQWSAILLDLTMPVMDGRAFREVQRRDPALTRIPVIVTSAFRDVEKKVAGLDVASCLAKPIELPALLDLLRKL